MWLTSSSIGRKFVMAITGICLVLFVTFHVLMNSVALLWPAAYNQICMFLGANWYALAASAGLALLFIIHIIYALWLTVQNRKARGNDRYAVNAHYPGVEWSSKNMLVLGIVVLAFLVVHLIQFWAKMQLQELMSHSLSALPTVHDAPAAPEFGTLFLQAAFENWWTPVVYIIGFVALWFHMNHGFWSMFQTIGWSGSIWLPRLKTIACWWTSIVILLFVAQAITFSVQANKQYFLTAPALQEQYAEYWNERAQALIEEFQAEAATLDQTSQEAATTFFAERGDYYSAAAEAISNAAEAQAPQCKNGQYLQQIGQFGQFVKQRAAQAKVMNSAAQQAPQAEEAAEVEETETTNE